jgi:hypothetical protein
LAVSGTPTAAAHWFGGTVQVTVRDRKLTVTNGPGALDDKIDYIDVLAG